MDLRLHQRAEHQRCLEQGVVDQPRALQAHGQREHRARADLRTALERLGIAQLHVVEPRQRLVRDPAGARWRSRPRRAAPARTSAAPRGARRSRGGLRARARAEERVARGSSPGRRPRARSGRRRSRRRTQVATMRRITAQLLVVLLAEERDVRPHGVKQLRHHGRDAAEVPGRLRPQRPARESLDRDPGATPSGYISSTDGAKSTSTPASRRLSRSRVEVARIAREVLGRPELRRVHEDRQRPRGPRSGRALARARGARRGARPSSARARCGARPRARRRPRPGALLGRRCAARAFARGSCSELMSGMVDIRLRETWLAANSSAHDFIGRARASDLGASVRVRLHEASASESSRPEQVVHDEHLAVAARAGADADRRDRERCGDLSARSGGMPSSTIAKAPASSSARASSSSSRAPRRRRRPAP